MGQGARSHDCKYTASLLQFVVQIGVFHNMNTKHVEHYPMSSGFLDEAYNIVNHILVVSRCFVPWPAKANNIGTLDPEAVFLRFLGKYPMNELRSKLNFILIVFPRQWWYYNYCLCCSWWALKTNTTQNVQSPVGKECRPAVRALSFFLSRLQFRFCR